MSTIEVPEEVASRFAAEAARRGVSIHQLLRAIAEDLPDEDLEQPEQRTRRLGFVSLGSSTTGRPARDADAMLADGFGRN